MKLIWIASLGLLFIASPSCAEEAIVIDSRMLSEIPGAPASEATTPPSVENATSAQDEANRERLLKGHKLSARQQREIAKAELADRNKQLGEEFLAINKVKQGVVTLPSGVQYMIIRAGKGRNPTEESVIMCRYTGNLTDGSTVASSASKNPVPVIVSTLVPGLKEAVKLMPSGSKWEIVIPPQLAYGQAGNRGVGPNAVLIYSMDISSIK
ncbi:MAG: FKBP-type peptidyl-prolyl cis-trans isomerase [Gallionella sp.]